MSHGTKRADERSDRTPAVDILQNLKHYIFAPTDLTMFPTILFLLNILGKIFSSGFVVWSNHARFEEKLKLYAIGFNLHEQQRLQEFHFKGTGNWDFSLP